MKLVHFLVFTLFLLHPSFSLLAATIQLPKTGQTTSYHAADDGVLQKGVAWPNPRFTSNNNGTVTDNLTGLIWLQDANCTDTFAGISKTSGFMYWPDALTWSNGLYSGDGCGLTDGSVAGDWRLPNINELESLLDLGRSSPALPNGHPFINVQSLNHYWTSNSYASAFIPNAWYVSLVTGSVGNNNRYSLFYVLPVRGGQ